MQSVERALAFKQYQELNEPQVFSWRYIRRGLSADVVTHGAVQRSGVVANVLVSLTWRNKAKRVAAIIVYDERRAYCLLDEARFKSPPDAVGIRKACRISAEKYVKRLVSIALGNADYLHPDSHHNYKKYKQELICKVYGANA